MQQFYLELHSLGPTRDGYSTGFQTVGQDPQEGGGGVLLVRGAQHNQSTLI